MKIADTASVLSVHFVLFAIKYEKQKKKNYYSKVSFWRTYSY